MNDNGKRTTTSRSDSESRYEAVLETMVDALITIDEHGVVLSGNSAVKRIFGYDADELIGQNVSMLMPAAFSADHNTHINMYLETGKARIIGIGRETIGRRADRSVYPQSGRSGIELFPDSGVLTASTWSTWISLSSNKTAQLAM